MKILSWILVVIGVLGLISVRVLEDRLFYDPFLNYFQEANTKSQFPEFIWSKLVLSHLLRFVLNLAFSCLIIQFLFNKKQWTLQGVFLIVLVFCITFPLYLFCIHDRFEIGKLFSFYTRRFVIQPLIVLLIIPLYYYRKQVEKIN